MAMKPVKIRLRGTHAAVRRLDRQVSQGVTAALREAAQFGLTAVERQIQRTRPRPVARGDYRMGWVVKKTRGGAILGNSTPQSVQIEVGRQPGSPPPLDPLKDWVIAKRLVKPIRAPRRRARKKRRDLGARTDKQRERAAQRRYKSFLKRTRSRNAQALAIASRISKHIGRHGVQGRYPLAKSLPRTQRFVLRQMRQNVRGVLAKHKG